MSKLRVVENMKTIEDLFSNLSKQEEIPVSVHNGQDKKYAMLKFLEDEKSPYIVYRDGNPPMKSGEETELTFFYKETFINFFTSIEEILGEKYLIKKPSSLKTSYKRTKTRYKVMKDDHVFIVIYGLNDRYPVIDISTSGLSFESDRDLFDEGQAIRNIMVTLGTGETVYVDGVVKYAKTVGEGFFRFGVEFLSIEWIFYQKIFSFIFEKSYPDIKQVRDFSLEDISNLYNESKYIRPKNTLAEKNILNDILKIEQLKNKPMISINLVQQREENITAIASALRSSNQSFYVQQLLTMQDQEIENIQKTDLYAGLADSLLGHPYFESLLMYVHDDVEWDLEMFRIMQEIIGDEDKVYFKALNAYTIKTDQQYGKTSIDAYNLDQIKPFLTYSSQIMNGLEKSSYSYTSDSFWLEKLQETYANSGYKLERKIFEVKKRGEVIAYGVGEIFSKDIDVDGFMNNLRFHVVNPNEDVNEMVTCLLKQASLYYKRYGVEQFTLLTDRKVTLGILDEEVQVHRLLMSREGVVEFLYFLKANIV
jgi:hypothetical protein